MNRQEALNLYKSQVEEIREAGLFKNEAPIVTPQGAHVKLEDGRELLCMCANNYLGLGDDQGLIDAAKAEQDAGELPELATAVDISGYNTVFVVYPVWWYTMPQAIYSFIDEYDLSGKTVIPVTTHGGSGLADSIERFKELEPNADVKDGYDVNGDDVGGSQSDIEGWLSDNGF